MRPFRCPLLACFAAVPLAAQALPPDQLFEKVEPSSWTVLAVDGEGRSIRQGSGVVIASGRLVTNCHVLSSAKGIQVSKDNVSYRASLEFADPERDLCQIKVANFHAPLVEIGDVLQLRVGQKVYAVGTPKGLELTMSDGLVSSLRKGDEEALPLIQTTAALSPGSSGGGLFSADGKLIGITTFLIKDGQNLNFAHPANWIREIEARHKAAQAKTEAAATQVTHGQRIIPGYNGPHRIGDQWVYNVTDLYTKNKRTVRYRVDDIDAKLGQITFNNGGRIEDLEGNVVSLTAFDGGEFDASMPPGGWARHPSVAGQRWHVKYEKTNRTTSAAQRFDLNARVVREETVFVPAGEFATTRIDWEGHSGATHENGTYRASVWYSSELKRVVKFSVEYISSGMTWLNTRTREMVELVSYPGKK